MTPDEVERWSEVVKHARERADEPSDAWRRGALLLLVWVILPIASWGAIVLLLLLLLRS